MPNTLKVLVEQRAEKLDVLDGLLNAAKGEKRAMTKEEQEKFAALETEISDIDKTLELEERARKFTLTQTGKTTTGDDEPAKIYDAFLRRGEIRADVMSTTENGNIIPAEFSNDIIRKTVELSGIFSAVTKVNSRGIYKQIVENNKISAGWTPELNTVMASTADFKIVEIGHHKMGSLVKLSFEIINQAEFSVINEVNTQMADAFTYKAEEALIKGTGIEQPTGLMSGGTKFDLAAATAVTADELIKTLHALKAPYFPKASWLMNRNTLCAIRLLKDANGQYLFNMAELTSGFAGYILGKPVILSEIMPDFQIMFGDFGRAYKANVNPQMTIQILNEMYINQGAKGIIGFMYFDGKPVNNEAYIVAKTPE